MARKRLQTWYLVTNWIQDRSLGICQRHDISGNTESYLKTKDGGSIQIRGKYGNWHPTFASAIQEKQAICDQRKTEAEALAKSLGDVIANCQDILQGRIEVDFSKIEVLGENKS